MWSNDLPEISAETGPPRERVQRAAWIIAPRCLTSSARNTAGPYGLVGAKGDFAVLGRASFSRKTASLCQSLEDFLQISAVLRGCLKIRTVITEGLEHFCLRYLSLSLLEIHLVGAD